MKRVISIILFFLLLWNLVCISGEILTDKSLNRYYILEKELEKNNEKYDVQIYGSCHAYTSFNPMYLVNQYDVSAYNMSNPSEIIPTTYLRMKEQFKVNKPKVAFVEVWGINAYETYISTEAILGDYLKSNLERVPLSLEKLEVIHDFQTLDIWEENIPMIKYKDRILKMSLTEADFNYSFDLADKIYNTNEDFEWLYDEMKNRFINNGYKPVDVMDVSDYLDKQSKIEEYEIIDVESVMIKYLDKIIELCDENNVDLIFYRAPYRATRNELGKVNFLKKYFLEKQIQFFDLEEEIEFNYKLDFGDYEHLSKNGARKSTEFLCNYILNDIDWEKTK